MAGKRILSKKHDIEQSLAKLSVADPKLADAVICRLKTKEYAVSDHEIDRLISESIWGLSQEISFGWAFALGFAELIGEVSSECLNRYRDLVRAAGRSGPTLGRIMAAHLVPVVRHADERLLENFLRVQKIMMGKGSYTLNGPFEALGALLNSGDLESAWVYLEVLADTFSKALTYSQCQHFASILPKTILGFDSTKRLWQAKQLHRVLRTDFSLAEPFLAGMQRGLYLLSQKALDNFVRQGFQRYHRNRNIGLKFFALESKTALDTCKELQVTVPLFQVRQQLNRYIQARTGLALTVRGLSTLPKSFLKTFSKGPVVCSDGKFIYLPDEIGIFPTKDENVKLYKILTRLESAFYEFNSFDFDLENFFPKFPNKALAADLFAIFELARLRRRLSSQYPGLVRQSYPVLRNEATRLLNENPTTAVVSRLYALLTLDLPLDDIVNCNSNDHELVASIATLFEAEMNENTTVSSSAELVLRTYDDIQEICISPTRDNYLDGAYRPLKTAFGWQPRPNLFFSAHPEYDRMAEKLRVCLAAKGLTVSPFDVKKRLLKNDGFLCSQDIMEITGGKEFDSKEIEELLKSSFLRFLDQSQIETFTDRVFWYKEWDHTLADYLHNYVRVLERTVSAAKNDFYQQVLNRHDILIKRMRRAFELLKPEGLSILRQWVEGDEFDYRALLDFAVDKKSGIMPSDRLYMKRMKQQRDVAVLLLVDLSHSTSSLTSGSRASVLDVEKEAIVIFSEALDAVGDTFAIAGFSGTGRLGVDYYWLKNFEEVMNNTVRHRIDAIVPQRNTRMGAAIRHAAGRLKKLPSKVRLLIILGDGFPNDVNYKHRYAIADTRQALLEARSNNIYVHAITVNIAADPKLDDIFGNVHHNIISDVCELPDRLPWIYGALTKR